MALNKSPFPAGRAHLSDTSHSGWATFQRTHWLSGLICFRRGQTSNHFCFAGWHGQNKTLRGESCWCTLIDQTLYLFLYCTCLFWLNKVDLHVTTHSDCIRARGILFPAAINIDKIWMLDTFITWIVLKIWIKLQIKNKEHAATGAVIPAVSRKTSEMDGFIIGDYYYYCYF